MGKLHKMSYRALESGRTSPPVWDLDGRMGTHSDETSGETVRIPAIAKRLKR
jgi:hypothetical protein